MSANHDQRAKGQGPTVETLLLGYISSRDDLSETSVSDLGRTARFISRQVGTKSVSKLTRSEWAKFLRSLNCGGKRKQNITSLMRQALDFAADEGVIDSNPLHGFKVRKRVGERREKTPFTPEQIQRFCREAGDAEIGRYFLFMCATGLRSSEALGLRWTDIDLRGRTLKVRRACVWGVTKELKTKAAYRTVKLIQPAIDALKAQEPHTRFAGNVWTYKDDKAAWSAWEPIRDKADLEGHRLMDSRHTFASIMLTAGESIRDLSQQMGHANVGITLTVYAEMMGVNEDFGSKAEAMFNG